MKRTITIMLSVAMLLLLCACGGSTKTDASRNVSVTGAIDQAGNVVFPRFDGKFEQFTNYDTKTALMSPDRNKFAFLDLYGTLKVSETGKSESKTIAKDVIDILAIYNDGITYYSEQENSIVFHAYSFITEVDIATIITASSDFVSNRHSSNLHVAFKSAGNHIMYYNASLAEAEKIGSYTAQPMLKAIAADGSVIVWSEVDGKKEVVFSCENGELNRVCEFENNRGSSSSLNISMNRRGTYYVIIPYEMPVVYLKRVGEFPIKYELKKPAQAREVYTQNGLFVEDCEDSIKGIYVKDALNELFYLDASGGVTQVIAGKHYHTIQDGKLYYMDDEFFSDEPLYSATISEDSIKDVKTIASDVTEYYVAGSYLYYCRKIGVDTNIYVQKGNEKAIKISTGGKISCFSQDGKTVYYFKDYHEEKVNRTDLSYGSLITYTYGDTSETLVDTNVLWGSLNSGNWSLSLRGSGGWVQNINSAGFAYRAFKNSNATGYSYGYMYYNGKAISEIVKQAIQYVS